MIKGITFISAVASAGTPGAEFDRLTSLFSALGFEQGKGWQDAEGRGASFLAPLGNLEFVTGRRRPCRPSSSKSRSSTTYTPL